MCETGESVSSKVGGKVTHPDSNAVLESPLTLRLCGFKKRLFLLRSVRVVVLCVCSDADPLLRFSQKYNFLTVKALHDGCLDSLLGIAS